MTVGDGRNNELAWKVFSRKRRRSWAKGFTVPRHWSILSPKTALFIYFYYVIVRKENHSAKRQFHSFYVVFTGIIYQWKLETCRISFSKLEVVNRKQSVRPAPPRDDDSIVCRWESTTGQLPEVSGTLTLRTDAISNSKSSWLTTHRWWGRIEDRGKPESILNFVGCKNPKLP